MIVIQLNKEDYEYDIYSLVKAFYPSEDISVHTVSKAAAGPVLLRIFVDYGPGSIRVGLQEPNDGLQNTEAVQQEIKAQQRADQEGVQRLRADQEGAQRPGADQEGAQRPWADQEDIQRLRADQEGAQRAWADQEGAQRPWTDQEGAQRPWTDQEGAQRPWTDQEGAQRQGSDAVLREADFAVDESNRRETKNLLKQNIYRLLSAYTGRILPWGTLTGIRPTKIAMTMLEEGKTAAQITDYMEKTYSASIEKINLSIEIAQRELELLHSLDIKNGYSLYIGIPFCPSTCLYCSFTSFPVSKWKNQMDIYLDALEKEIAFTAEHFAGRHLNSIYIGGGTPTTLAPKQLDRLLTALKQQLDLSHLLEFTAEAGRPDSIDREKLEVLRAHGISRISINPQTMKQETLDLIGRHHTVADTVDSFYLARSMGFDNINMDLIMGLPQETLSDVRHTLERLKELAPDSITVHSLALKRAARLQMFKEDYADYKIINTQDHLDAAANVCAQMGMVPYYLYRQKNMAGNFENVGYAKEGKAGIYNVLMMEEKQTIVACGAGSISKRVYPDGRIERCENVKDVASFIERIDEMIERKRKLFED